MPLQRPFLVVVPGVERLVVFVVVSNLEVFVAVSNQAGVRRAQSYSCKAQ